MKPELLLAAANKDNTQNQKQKVISWFGSVLGQDIIDEFESHYMTFNKFPRFFKGETDDE